MVIHLTSRIATVTAMCRGFSPEPVGCGSGLERPMHRLIREPIGQLIAVVGTADAAVVDSGFVVPDRFAPPERCYHQRRIEPVANLVEILRLLSASVRRRCNVGLNRPDQRKQRAKRNLQSATYRFLVAVAVRFLLRRSGLEGHIRGSTIGCLLRRFEPAYHLQKSLRLGVSSDQLQLSAQVALAVLDGIDGQTHRADPGELLAH